MEVIKRYWKKIVLGLFGLVILATSLIFALPDAQNGVLNGVNPEAEQDTFGGVESANWFVFDRFTGFKTKADPSKLGNGDNPNGQNTIINDGDRISIRDFGYTLFGQASTTQNYVGALHTFRRRDGENIMLRASGTYLEYYEEGNDLWEALVTTSTSPLYDFADFNLNADLRSYTYFGNATDAFSRWSGSHVLTSVAVTSTATFVLTDNPTGKGFPDTGDIVYCGKRIPYTSWNTNGFQVASAHECAIDRGVAHAPEEFNTIVKGNIYQVANNRLFVSGIASTTQAIYFSRYGNPTDFVGANLITDAVADAPGIFNLGEGGGAVTGLALDEGAIYAFKKSIIYKITLDGDGLYSLTPLKPFDGNSQTTGAVTDGSVFTGGNGVFFITPDKQIMNLSRIPEFDYPQIVPISDVIKPTIQTGDYASSTGIFFQNTAYISARSNPSETERNDAVFVWNDVIRAWESPIIGWNPSVFTIYDDGNGEELYFGDSRVAQIYKVTDSAIDNELGVTANWRSKRYDFGEPHHLKELDNFYIEGYISDNTTLEISLLFDENGDTQTYTTEFSGTETDYIFDAPEFNLFGFHPFGFERFGSSDTPDVNKFRIYLNKNLRRVPFYNLQLEVASDGVAQSWEITSYGFRIRRSTQPEDGNLYRAF